MITAGLTGSIGMGKSTVTRMFADEGAATWNADEAVHRLYAAGGAAVAPVGAAFPGVVRNGAIDREKLSTKVLGDAGELRRLEALVHPLVAADRADFLAAAKADGAWLAVLDIPLLFETGAEQTFDAVIVVSAPYEIQRERVLAREGMSEERFLSILKQQVADADKRARADFIINTGGALDETRREVREATGKLRQLWLSRQPQERER